jgi:hypothetical protein
MSYYKHYKKINNDEIFILSVDSKNNYAIASNLDPEPDCYTDLVWELGKGLDPAEWQEITAAEASEVLGYDVEE